MVGLLPGVPGRARRAHGASESTSEASESTAGMVFGLPTAPGGHPLVTLPWVRRWPGDAGWRTPPGQATGVSGARCVLLPGGHASLAGGGREPGRGLGDAASGVPATAQCR